MQEGKCDLYATGIRRTRGTSAVLQKAMGACCSAVQIYRRYRLPSSVTASRASGKDIFKARYIIRMDVIMKSELHNTRRPRDAI